MLKKLAQKIVNAPNDFLKEHWILIPTMHNILLYDLWFERYRVSKNRKFLLFFAIFSKTIRDMEFKHLTLNLSSFNPYKMMVQL